MVEAAGGRVEWTIVGSPPVARAMQAAGAPFGGEGNGGFLFARHQYAKDGLMAMARMLELVASGPTMAQLAASVPRYALVKEALHVPADQKDALQARFDAAVADLADVLRIDARDGCKAYLADGWVLVRPSGTEPIYRVQAEGKDAATARAYADRFKAILAGCVD